MIKIHKPESQRFCKSLIFSPAGHGKTVFLGTAQDDSRTAPMLLLDFEGGTSSLVGRDIDIVSISGWQEYNDVYEFLSSSKGPEKYRSIGVDSASETHIMALLHQLEASDRSRKIPDLLEPGDYGIAVTQMRRFLRAFRDLPYHVFTTALAKDETDPKVGLVKKPAFAGGLADEIPGIFDVVAYLALYEGKLVETEPDGLTHRVLLLKNYPKIRVKTRTPIGVQVPDELYDPTVSALLDALQFPQED